MTRCRDVAASLLMLLLGGCDRDDLDYAVGTIERYRIDVVADSGEPVIELNVLEGDRVHPGMPLLAQDPGKLKIALDQAHSEEAVAFARLREAEAGPRAQEIDKARAQLASSRAVLATAENELERQRSLIARNYASESRVNLLQGEVDTATARVEEITAQLAELLEGTRSEQIDQARAAYAATQARVADLSFDMQRTIVRSPVSGVVESLPFRLGERPARGQTVITLLSDERTFARVHIPQPLRTGIGLGDTALIRVDGHEQEYSGRVRWISSEAAFTPYYALTQHDRSRLAYLAEIDLIDAVDLPVGVPAEVRFPGLAAD
ncbi:MAG: HlyD family efflux transporter periplasmic adaptor subunit [Gammaproteobacteria bacterium]|nr:MAG: HlyD family efflux transporter periplasmic adaptor subunit [Gammaproteobacteria bacterium]